MKKIEIQNKFSKLVFIILFVLSLAALVSSLMLWDWFKISMALIALVLYFVPIFVLKVFKIQFPGVLETVYYLFVFAALILGEVFAFYGPFPFWDIVLHFLSGFIFAGVGFSLIEILNKNKISKALTVIFAFCFSVTIGILWECVEFGFDMTVRTDAQKDAHVKQISTITLQRDGGNQPVRLDNIINTEIHLENGETVTIDEGFLDIGIIDTMKDILVNILGAGLFLIPGMFYLKNSSKIANSFILTKKST